MSHLLQMRGLKPKNEYGYETLRKSHLLQMRGLKPQPGMDCHRQDQVASFTDAWIETIRIKPEFGLRFVASFTDAWIETHQSHERDGQTRRIFYRCVD